MGGRGSLELLNWQPELTLTLEAGGGLSTATLCL